LTKQPPNEPFYTIHCANNQIRYITQNIAKTVKLPNLTDFKLMMPNAASSNHLMKKSFIANPNESCNRSKTFFVLKNYQEGINLQSWLNTILAKFLMAMVQDSHSIKSLIFRLLPEVDLSIAWTDRDIQAYFGITQDEEDYMAECIANFNIDKQ